MIQEDYYTQLPNYFFAAIRTGLSKSAIVTFCAICQHCFDKEISHPSTRRIMDLTGLSRRAVINGRNELVTAGLLTVQNRKNEKGSNDVNVYKIRKPWLHAAPSVEKSDKLSTGGSPMTPGVGSPMTPKEEEVKEVTVTVTQSSDIIQDTVPSPSPPTDAAELIASLATTKTARRERARPPRAA